MKKIKILKIWYKDLQLMSRDAPKIRGFFANKYNEIEMFHNHKGNKFIYKYPFIQYKVINKEPLIIGIDEGVNIIKKYLLWEDHIIIGDEKITLQQLEIKSTDEEFGLLDKIIDYQFKSPWMALSQKNFKTYYSADIIEKEEILKRIFIGNILSCSKALNYEVKELIRVKLDVSEVKVIFKGKEMIGFKGAFATNFAIPDYIGIGKSVSRGFGSIKRR